MSGGIATTDWTNATLVSSLVFSLLSAASCAIVLWMIVREHNRRRESSVSRVQQHFHDGGDAAHRGFGGSGHRLRGLMVDHHELQSVEPEDAKFNTSSSAGSSSFFAGGPNGKGLGKSSSSLAALMGQGNVTSTADLLGPAKVSPTAKEKLVISLFLADFILNAFNLTTSIMKFNQSLTRGLFCTIDGILVQWSVQASDLSTLALAIVTFYIGTKTLPSTGGGSAAIMSSVGQRKPVPLRMALKRVERALPVALALIWIIPAMTAITGYLVVGMEPSGDWCWFSAGSIQSDPSATGGLFGQGALNPDGTFVHNMDGTGDHVDKGLATAVRYSLAHGPRIAIIFIIMT
ncbi:hypothetical protein HK101_002227, partial [Irineochytrium annulatum]